MLRNHHLPTESFPLANDRILALVLGGQLTTDHLMGTSGFFAPGKESLNLLQGIRTRLVVDGETAECLDGPDSRIVGRGFVGSTSAVRILWRQHDLEIEELFFIPPDPDVVIQRSRIRNLADRPRTLRVFSIIYPQLGSEVHHKKGACREARYEAADGTIVIADGKGNVLVHGLDRMPHGFQVGEVCGLSDVYYDLEDQALSGQASVAGVVPNAAVSWDTTLEAGGETTLESFLGRTDSAEAAATLTATYRRCRAELWEARQRADAATLQKSPVSPTKFGAPLRELEERGRLILKSCLLPDGAPLGGFTCYHNVGQTRNSCYILLALDLMGYHDEVRQGYGYYANFKVGDDRFASADENDQLGTILHVFRENARLTGSTELWTAFRPALEQFADRLVGLADPANGLIYSERSIHEFVAISRGYETYVNVMAWRGLQDAAEMAALLGDELRRARYAAAAAALREAVLRHLIDPDRGIFVKRIYLGRRVPLPAVSVLTPALFGLVDPQDETVTRSIAWVREHLWDPQLGGIYRYPLELQPWPEHPYGGPWVTYTSWLGRVHLLRGEIAAAEEILDWALGQIPADSRLIPEHFSAAHAGRRGFHRIYLDPSTPELWATAEFLRFVLAYRQAVG